MIETVPSGTILHGRYRIERVLGSGGFGHVYLAIDLVTNQQYAVKEYLVSGSSGQEQLQHEATVLSHLRHPNMPGFQDAFIERGRYYIVINYIEGNDLTDLVRMARQRNESIPIRQILTWLLAICDAVMFMHSQRPTIIHRDIKPDNIRITPNGTAVLVDLGNAKAAADGARTLFFIRHQGTPGYAPPEQYPGGTGTDARSDVYALGGTLYFVLTAHEPPSVSTRNQSLQQGQRDLPSLRDHIASNPPEESAEAKAARQFRLGVTKPSKPAPQHSRHIEQLETLPPAVLQQIDQIIQKSMAMKPKNRYQFVADFANDLKNVIAALPGPPSPTPSRRGDPNSTQPDLPDLYDALQEAKEHANQTIQEQGTQPMGPNNYHCPRCNAPLAQKAAFCPRCGAALNASTNSQVPAVRAQAYAKTPSAENTVIAPQGRMKEASASYAAVPRSFSRSTSARQPAIRPERLVAQQVQSVAPNTTPPAQPRKGVTTNPSAFSPADTGSQPAPAGPEIDPRLWLLLVVVIVLLVILGIVVLHTLALHGYAAAYLSTRR